MTPEAPPFRFWVRRSPGAGSTYALRFEVFDGKGVLRVSRPGRLVDPPARGSGYEPDLEPTAVRGSQFVHLSAQGNRRQTWFLSRVNEPLLHQLAPGAWLELVPQIELGAPHLVVVPPEPAQPEPLAPPRPLPVQAAPSQPAPAPALPVGEPALQTAATEAASATARPAEPAAPRRTRRTASPPPFVPEDPTSRMLVRHLRRQLAEARLQNEVLEGRVRELERKLALGDYFPEPIEAAEAPEDLAELY